jgi:hypothetical protein
MPFNISEFKSQFDRYGGPAMANLFSVQVTLPPELQKRIPENNAFDMGHTFTFFCHKMDIPAIGINTSEVAYTGQMKKKHPTRVQNPGPMSASFFVDSDHHVLRFFHAWAQNIVNYNKGNDVFGEVHGKLPHEVGFKKDFACDMIIKHYATDSYPDVYYETKLQGVWPVSVGALSLDWSTNTALTLDVQFTVTDMSFDGAKSGKTNSRLSRASGLLDILGDIAGFGDAVRGTLKSGKPTSIQDAINKLDRLGNAFGKI